MISTGVAHARTVHDGNGCAKDHLWPVFWRRAREVGLGHDFYDFAVEQQKWLKSWHTGGMYTMWMIHAKEGACSVEILLRGSSIIRNSESVSPNSAGQASTYGCNSQTST
eukprot:1004151-Amphidinium_carterae.1